MKILHISDWHGNIWPGPKFPTDYDIIVSSGDMLPNCSRGNVWKEIKFQFQWVGQNLERFQSFIGNRPFLHCSGNHDFIDLALVLHSFGIEAHSLNTSWITIMGKSFAGFPYVPFIQGEWNFECRGEDLNTKVKSLVRNIIPNIDILVCHCPPYGILDSPIGPKLGNVHLTNHLFYSLEEEYRPKLILCGHFHESSGMVEEGGMKIYNSACDWSIIDV